MITFKLEDKTAEVMMAVLKASNPNASFVEELNTQYGAQTVVTELPAAVAAFMAGEPHEQFDEDTPEPEVEPEEE
jgi:hypothetical protein